jgi:acyl-CoA thioester hydrolase
MNRERQSSSSGNGPPARDIMELRVRYVECDPMGLVHHSIYPVWFEMGRTELLRKGGMDYRDLEARNTYLAVVSLSVTYKRPARYDDIVHLHTSLKEIGHVKIEHEYALYREEELLTTASTVLACLDREGRLRAMPETLVGA